LSAKGNWDAGKRFFDGGRIGFNAVEWHSLIFFYSPSITKEEREGKRRYRSKRGGNQPIALLHAEEKKGSPSSVKRLLSFAMISKKKGRGQGKDAHREEKKIRHRIVQPVEGNSLWEEELLFINGKGGKEEKGGGSALGEAFPGGEGARSDADSITEPA